jgi:mannose-1-phosphate guanylyltransferase
MYVVIMAGGGGTRLHPLSTPERPKPFLPLLGAETLLQRTVSRLLDGPELRGAGLARSDITVVAAGSYAPLVREQLPGVGLLGEPTGRNTAAAIALATLALDRPEDEVMVVLPADHRIEREAVFRSVLRAAAGSVATGAAGVPDPLVTLGIQPDEPSTEYGYLRPRLADRADVDGLTTYPLESFIEKPDRERAVALLAEPGIAWNAGMFVWRRRAIRAALARHAPDILEGVGEGLEHDRLAEAYGEVRARSIDYAVMEPAAAAGVVVMAAMDVGWSDLGGWTSLLGALGAGGTGRVLEPGGRAELGREDLAIRRVDGRLMLDRGPLSGILDADGPSAILHGADADLPIVEALIARCTPPEDRSS